MLHTAKENPEEWAQLAKQVMELVISTLPEAEPEDLGEINEAF